MAKRFISFSLITLIINALFSCVEKFEFESRFYPMVNTFESVKHDSIGPVVSGEILTVGSESILDHGFIYGSNELLTLERSDKVSLGSVNQSGPFSSSLLRNLSKGSKYYFRAFALTENVTVLGQLRDFNSEVNSVLEIYSFNPKQGNVGDTIIITGNGFSNNSINNGVKLGGVATEPFYSNSDTIKTIVPFNTEVGDNELEVSVGQFEKTFTETFHLGSLTISQVNFNTASFGEILELSGSNVASKEEWIKVIIFDEIASVINSENGKVRFKISNNIQIVESSTIEIIIGLQKVIIPGTITLNEPKIESFSPTEGAEGRLVTIFGENFNLNPSNNKVKFGDNIANVLTASQNELLVTVGNSDKEEEVPITVRIIDYIAISDSLFHILGP